MKPLASGGLDEGGELQLVEHTPQPSCTFDHARPAHAGARIEIQDHAVGLLQMSDPGTPRMDFEHAHLSETDQSALVLHEEIFPADLALHDLDGLEMLRNARSRMLLEEACFASPLRTAKHAQGTLDDVREDPLTDPLVELGQVELGQSLLRIEHSVGVRQPHPGDFTA